MGARHAARRLALQALYALDMNPALGAEEALLCVQAEQEPVTHDQMFFETLVTGTWQRRAEIDRAIRTVSQRWKLERMDRVDKGILRLGTFELLHCPDNPVAVVIDESVELAKEFGTPDSPSFVNGMLDRIAHEHCTSRLDEKPG
jgi:N utilization substance protein B